MSMHPAAPHAYVTAADPVPDLLPTEPFEAPKYGLATRIPKDWTDRGARRGRSDLRGDHPPERLRPARRGGLRAGTGARDARRLSHPDRHHRQAERPPQRQARDQSSHQGCPRRAARDDLGISPRAGGLLARSERAHDRQPPALHVHSQRRRLDLRQGSARPSTLWSPRRDSRPPTPAPTCWRRPRTGGFSASTSSHSTCRKAGHRSSLPARLRSSSPMGRPTASGPTIFWCWLIPIATPTWTSWPGSFPTSSAEKTPVAK